MIDDDEAARRAKADALRQRIAALKSPESGAEVSDDDAVAPGQKSDDETIPKGESPREFVHRRMRELEGEGRENDGSDSES